MSVHRHLARLWKPRSKIAPCALGKCDGSGLIEHEERREDEGHNVYETYSVQCECKAAKLDSSSVLDMSILQRLADLVTRLFPGRAREDALERLAEKLLVDIKASRNNERIARSLIRKMMAERHERAAERRSLSANKDTDR